MSNDRRDAGGYMGWFLFGAVLGAGVALLMAPKTGAQARELLAERGGDVARRAQEFANEAQGRAGEWIDKSREIFEEQTQRLMSAVEAGRDAMRDEIHERGETAFGRRAALTTAIYAVVLSIAALGGNNTVKEMLLAQQQSSDQWAFYQAKVIREHQYRGQKMLLETQLAEPSTLKGAEREKLAALAAKFAEEEKRYGAEKKDIEKDAKKLEHARDLFRA